MKEMEQIWIVCKCPSCTERPVDAVGNELALHQWPVIRDIAGVQSRYPCAEQQLDEQDRSGEEGRPRQAGGAVFASFRQILEVERSPDQRSHDEEREQQMGRE